MNVTLISPYLDIQAFGIRTLSACLKRVGMNTQILFLRRFFAQSYEDRVLDEVVEITRGADLIGISLMTNFFDNAAQITQRLKKDLNIPILWGGVHPTVRPAECLDYADVVCVGEGENTLVELARRMQQGQDYYNTRGLWLKNKSNIITNAVPSLIEELDSIPFPDYDCETHFVLDEDGIIRKMDEGLLKKYSHGLYMTMPTRGCPFGCSYCCNNTFNKMYPHQKPLRKRSIGNLIGELAQVKVNLPAMKYIKFDDDAFFLYTTEEIKEFSEKYRKNVGLPLIITGATPTTLTREKLSLLVDAGLIHIRMGIQTGSERIKKMYKRHYSDHQVEEAVGIINGFKDKITPPQYDIILDNPWETAEDLIATLLFLSKLPVPYVLSLFSLAFYPGTELYEMAKRDGLIIDDRNAYRKYYHGCKITYLNRLFSLLSQYASIGSRFLSRAMPLLVNLRLRQSKLNFLVYCLAVIIFRILRAKYLFAETMKDIKKGEWSRIVRHSSAAERLLDLFAGFKSVVVKSERV